MHYDKDNKDWMDYWKTQERSAAIVSIPHLAIEIIDCPSFVQQVTLPKRNRNGRIMRDNSNNTMYELQNSDDTTPNIPFLHGKGINLQSHSAH